MRRLVLVLTLLAACEQHPAAPPEVPVDPKLPSRIEMSTPEAATLLKEGFYNLEEGKWRWTAPQFGVTLAPPRPSLRLRFTLPATVVAQLKQVTLSAKVNGTTLAPETYDHAGDFEYVRPLDASLLRGPLKVEFSLDKPFKPGGADTRELGVIVYAVGVE